MALVIALAGIAIAVWALRCRSTGGSEKARVSGISYPFIDFPRSLTTVRSHKATVKDTLRTLMADPVGFVTNQISGAIGVALSQDPKTGFPVIEFVTSGSPADKAGLRAGDAITRVNGLGTTGKPLAQVVESMRGRSGGIVTLSLQRGSTNYERAIRRISWYHLRQL